MTDSLETIEVDGWLPAAPAAVFRAWIDGDQHSQMTESAATSEPREGGRFTAWDGYIEGSHITLLPPSDADDGVIVQSWRTSDFGDTDSDSRLEVQLSAEGDGTRVVIIHSQVPAGSGAQYAQGWRDYYLAPMKAYFGG